MVGCLWIVLIVIAKKPQQHSIQNNPQTPKAILCWFLDTSSLHLVA